jgi:UDP-3-O-[3-hydroxymyristoyl] glucosamine N-acyltransferase
MSRTIRELAEFLSARLEGDGRPKVTGVASLASAHPESVVFVEDARHLSAALASRAAAIIAGEFAGETVSTSVAKREKKPASKPGSGKAKRAPNGLSSNKAVLLCRHPRLAFARAAAFLAQAEVRTAGVHPTATVAPTARLADGVTVEERAVIRAGVAIGAGSIIGAGCVIGPDVKIGRDCRIYPNVTIYPDTTLGDRVTIHAGAVLGSDGFGYVRDPESGRYEKFPQIGRLVIEDDVEIGANATVDRGALDVTRIRRGTKIDNLVHVGHNVDVGADVVIAAQTGISGSSVVENGVVIGGQVGIADHVRIEAGAILGAQSGVPSKKIIRGRGVVFWGTPARPIKEYLKELAVLARLRRKGEASKLSTQS